MAQILWFENYQSADAPELGGKNASLGTLLGAGLPVPPGFAVSAECYRKALADGGLTGEIDALIAAVDPRDTASVAAAGERARALIGALRVPADLDAAIRGAYARLCEQCGDARLPVAWTPTVELTAHIRTNPAPGWLRCRFATRFVTAGFLEEDGEVWDRTGRLVGQSRQLALVPRG